MRIFTILTAALLLFASFANAKTIDDKTPTQDNWKKFLYQVCPTANADKLTPVIFTKDYKTEYDKPFIIQEGYVIKPKKINPDGSITKAHLKNISMGEIGRRKKEIPLPQLIAFLNEDGELVTEDGELVTESNPVKRYPLSSPMLNFIGRGEELMEDDTRKSPESRSYENEKSLLNNSKNCSYLQTPPQIFTRSSQWRRFDARYICSTNVLRRFSLRVDTSRFSKTKQSEIQPSMLFMKDHQGKITEGPLISLAEKFTELGEECDWLEVNLPK